MDSEKETPRKDIDDSQFFEGDEALRLVGTEAQKFSEDYNRRLRNKLVRPVGGIICSCADEMIG
jgi:hypothetical protein